MADAGSFNLIEAATRRLEELSRAGVTIPWVAASSNANPAAAPSESLPHSNAAAGVTSSAMPDSATEAARSSPPAVVINFERLTASGYITPGMHPSVTSEEFRSLRIVLLRQITVSDQPIDQRAHLVMVTSAVPGEGKTYCAVNLALSLAASIDTSVLLVDADVLRPSLPQRLGVSTSRGLLDLLLDPGLSLEQVVLETNVPKLSLLPAGTLDARAPELLASRVMDRLLSTIATRYANRVIIFDSPPLLASTTTAAFASRMGQVLMVVEASRTSQQVVAQAHAALEKCPNVLLVLNKCRDASAGHRYGDYYGYAYALPAEPSHAGKRWLPWRRAKAGRTT